jgi:putative peptide zinc metalloprotease protein
MAESLFSPSWYRVASLTPRLRGHARIYRHEYRGEVWYVLQDHAKGRYYRFNPATYQIVGLMNGERTVQQVWEKAAERLGDEGLTQQEVVQLLAQLHSADVLLCNVPPDTAELLERSKKVERAKWVQRIRSPLALRLPLLDPDKFLTRTVGLVRPLLSVFGAIVWLAVVGTGVVLAGLNWPELTRNIVDRVLSIENGLVMLAVYPFVKILHELGHGYAVKAWGGECHEMGIIFLVFVPVPYVDASAASEFRAKYRRVVVGSAGILVELFLASLALLVWIAAEPGVLRSFAYNVMLIGSVSTVLFNGNPLLRYDGYYILSDLLEIPNLAQRGQAYLRYLVQRYPFGNRDATRPHVGPGERFWFVSYTVSAFFYRLLIYTGIILFIAGKFFKIGLLIAAWVAFSWVVVPIVKGVKFLVSSPSLREKRLRAFALTGVAVLAAVLLLFAMPVPYRTRAEGVVWVPQGSQVRAGTNGFIDRVVATPNEPVEPGQLLLKCRDPLLLANVEVLRARTGELESRYNAALAIDRVQAKIVQQELRDVRAELDRAEERMTELEIRSPNAGVLVLANALDLPDRYVRQGDLIAFVVDVDRPTVRAVVPQSKVDLVRRRTLRVEVRLAEHLDQILPATIKREVPEAEEHLPSATLGSVGGGEFAIDPTEQSGTKTFERIFQFDIELDDPVDDMFIGGRAYVRFDHGYEPIALQWYRSLRQLFLKRFNL